MKHLSILCAAACALIASCSVFKTTAEIDPCPDAPDGARQSCTQVNAILPAGVQRAWGHPDNFWKLDADRTLTVGFLGGTGNERSMFRDALNIWREQLADLITIVIVADAKAATADIRVSFQCAGHWSRVGNNARAVPHGKATLNVDLFNVREFSEWRRVVLHEFGHALGLRHEHAHPASTIQWNEAAVFAFYAQTQGWDEKTTRAQIFTPAPDGWVGTLAADRRSIMHYPVPASLTLDGTAVGWNDDLTPADIAFVRQIYARPADSASALAVP